MPRLSAFPSHPALVVAWETPTREIQLAKALCKLNGEDPSAAVVSNDPQVSMAWHKYRPQAREALRVAGGQHDDG